MNKMLNKLINGMGFVVIALALAVVMLPGALVFLGNYSYSEFLRLEVKAVILMLTSLFAGLALMITFLAPLLSKISLDKVMITDKKSSIIMGIIIAITLFFLTQDLFVLWVNSGFGDLLIKKAVVVGVIILVNKLMCNKDGKWQCPLQ